MAKETESKAENKIEVTVVEKLPEQSIRSFVGENSVEYHLLTRDEALTKILELCERIAKSIA